MSEDFAARLLNWFDAHGRKDLPWQHPRDPYRTWVAEIMLQQTQVATVIPYFHRFMARFPTVTHLAEAPLDDVLHHWTGLGYYARARHLHRAAGQIVLTHGGQLPASAAQLEALPGIGRSTAAAILACAFDQPAAILDGNVKRVLARHVGIPGWPGDAAVLARLWTEAEARVPAARCADYTQALMDLGALVCRRGTPACGECPLQADCVAYLTDQVRTIPAARPRKPVPVRHLTLFLVQSPAGEWLLTQRPAKGVWGGLWSFPESPGHTAEPPDGLTAALAGMDWIPGDRVRHTLTHFQMDLLPLYARLSAAQAARLTGPEWMWYASPEATPVGLAAPVLRLLQSAPPTDFKPLVQENA